MQIEHPARSGFNIYARFLSGKKIRIIPIYKDEGIGGDRDYLQWDTISLMSLFGVHVIISYYIFAQRHPRRADKITAPDIARGSEMRLPNPWMPAGW